MLPQYQGDQAQDQQWQMWADRFNLYATLATWGYRGTALLGIVSILTFKSVCRNSDPINLNMCEPEAAQRILHSMATNTMYLVGGLSVSSFVSQVAAFGCEEQVRSFRHRN
jgi:hypothetical protein